MIHTCRHISEAAQLTLAGDDGRWSAPREQRREQRAKGAASDAGAVG